MRPLYRLAIVLFALVFLSGTVAVAQATKALITEKVDDNNVVTVRGNTPPAAVPANDRGAVNPSMAMTGMILTLHRSPEQQAAFDAFVASQYDSNSPNYHHWLEPDEVGEKFGPALTDIATVTSWLSSHGLIVESVSKDRMAIRFSGTASLVQQAFHTEIHNLMVNGEPHFSNMSDPQIPIALEPVVLGPKALHNFVPKPLHRLGAQVTRSTETGKWQRVAATNAKSTSPRPEIGFGCGTGCLIEDLTPYDFATIYNVLPLWNAATPIDGTGQIIGIAGRSDVRAADVASFRSTFGLPAGTFNLIKTGTDPGFCSGSTGNCTLDDQIENALDVEWSGAVAKGATIDLVVTQQTNTNDAIYESASYIITNKTAPVINVSYGLCELAEGTGGNAAYNSLWQSAASEGIGVFVAAGDGGSPSCDGGVAANGPYGAQYGLAVSGLASSQYDTAVGGTDLNWGSTAAPYWNSTNNSTTGATAKGYIPEVPWNDTCTNPIEIAIINQAIGQSYSAGQMCYYLAIGQITSAQNPQGALDLVNSIGGGGGASNCTTNGTTSNVLNPATCAGGYPKPSWQTTFGGTPNDSARDIPDVSFFSGNGFLGSAYLICVSDWGPCVSSPTTTTEPTVGEIGGTSAASPAMAGVMALINQKAGSAQGSPNAALYALAAKQTYSSCSAETVTAASASCYFNDPDTGTNAMACAAGSPNCTVAQSGFTYGVLNGFAAGTGFDNATGLGSLNVANVVNGLASTIGTAAATVTVTPATMSIVSNQSLSVTVTVTGASGTPTGSVSLSGGGYTSSSQTLSSGSVTIAIPANSLSAGSDTLTVSYSGDTTYATADGSATVTVTAAPTPTVTVSPATNPIIVNQSLSVPVTVAGTSGTPTGTVTLSGGGYASSAQTLASGAYTFTIPANSLTTGSVTLAAHYSGDSTYGSATGSAGVTVNPLPAPPVTVTPASNSINSGQSLNVTASVAGTPTPTGTVTLKSGTYTSAAQTLASGSATVAIPANSLGAGSDTLTVTYSGDSNYGASSGTASETVTQSTYTLAASAPAAINRGSSAASTITWTTTNNYSANINLTTCTLNAGSPSNSTADTPKCTLSSASFGTSGSGTATVTTSAATTGALLKPHVGGWAEAGGGAILAVLVFFGIPARRRGWRAMLGMSVLIFTLASLSGCGSGGGSNGGGGGTSDPGTASGSYVFTVKTTGADPAATTSTVNFTVTVN